MKTQSLLLVICSVLFLVSCAKDDDSSSSSSSSTPSAVFTKANNAVTSTYSSTSSSFVGSKRAGQKASFTCSNGSPSGLSQGDANYASGDVYCVLNSNSKSPDTVQGSYYLVSKILCAIEKTETFSYAATATNHDNITFNETDSCFGDSGFDANDDNDTADTITVSITEQSLTGSDYDYYIGIQLGATTFTAASVKLYLKDSNNILAARMYQESDKSQLEFVLNSSNNNMYFENKDYGNKRHIRLAANGTFNSEGTFSSVTSASYAHTEGDAGSEMAVMMVYASSAVSFDHFVSGSRDADYVATSITYKTDFSTWTSRAITDNDPLNDSLLDLSTFTMDF